MKKLILLTVLVSLIFISGNRSTASVTLSALPLDEISGGSNEWVLAKSNNNVEFSYKIDECNGQKAVFLKFVNKNNYKVTITWEEEYVDKKSGETFENFNGEKQLVLMPNSTLEASCNGNGCSECLIRFSMVTPTQPIDVQNFEFKNISVSVSK